MQIIKKESVTGLINWEYQWKDREIIRKNPIKILQLKSTRAEIKIHKPQQQIWAERKKGQQTWRATRDYAMEMKNEWRKMCRKSCACGTALRLPTYTYWESQSWKSRETGTKLFEKLMAKKFTKNN